MDDGGSEIVDGGLFAVDGFIRQVGPTSDLPQSADEIVDLTGHVVLPGLINTHHHFYQVLTRVVKPDGTLFPWLRTLYPIWAGMQSDDIYTSAQLAAAHPVSGGTYEYGYRFLTPTLGFLAGWMFLLAKSASAATARLSPTDCPSMSMRWTASIRT